MKKISTRTLALALALTSCIAFGGVAAQAAATPQDQYAAMEAMHDEYMQKTDPIYQDLFVKQNELDALMYQEKPDTAAIASKSKEIASLRSKLNTTRMEYNKKMRDQGMADGSGMGYGRGMRGDYPGAGMGQGRGMRGDCPAYNGWHNSGRNSGGYGYHHGRHHSDW